MPKKSAGKPASPLHAALVKNLYRLFQDRGGLSIKEGMKDAGGSEQLYNNVQRGASPTLKTVEKWAKRLDTSVDELLSLERPISSEPVEPTIESLIDAIDAWGLAAGIGEPTGDKEFLVGLVTLWNQHEERLERRRGGRR